MTDHVDLEVIEALKELGGDDDPDLFNELVEVFVSDTPARIDAMAEAVRISSAHHLMEAAHSLKSSAANMGAVGLADMCKKLEASGRADTTEGLEPLVQRAREEFEAVARLLRASAV